jgi:hypothetical protein
MLCPKRISIIFRGLILGQAQDDGSRKGQRCCADKVLWTAGMFPVQLGNEWESLPARYARPGNK